MEKEHQEIGAVKALALRTGFRAPMKEVSQVEAVKNGGLVGDVASRPDRGVTFLSSRQWDEVNRALGSELPWFTRRANVLIEADSLGHLIGSTVRVSDVLILIEGETKPCDLMDRYHDGLRDALRPHFHGGVFGRVLEGGVISVGAVLTAAD